MPCSHPGALPHKHMATDYESGQILAEYLHFHFASQAEYLPWEGGPVGAWDYPRRIVTQRLRPLSGNRRMERALDVGCAVGGTAFAMAAHCPEVIGIDFSSRFIEAARKLARDGSLAYRFPLQGHRFTESEARIDPAVDRQRVHFEVGDAQSLRPDLGSFDWVAAVNLLCRLPRPALFLNRLPSLVRPGGLLLINSPFSWMEEFTPPENWVGASPDASSEYALKAALAADFELIDEIEMPFLIRETERKYQWTVAHSACWRRR